MFWPLRLLKPDRAVPSTLGLALMAVRLNAAGSGVTVEVNAGRSGHGVLTSWTRRRTETQPAVLLRRRGQTEGGRTVMVEPVRVVFLPEICSVII